MQSKFNLEICRMQFGDNTVFFPYPKPQYRSMATDSSGQHCSDQIAALSALTILQPLSVLTRIHLAGALFF